MTTIPDAPYHRKVLLSEHRRYDQDIHLSKVEIEGKEYFDLREYIPSIDLYGRGIIVPTSMAASIGKALIAESPEESDV